MEPDLIAERLDTHIRSIGCLPSRLTADEWRHLPVAPRFEFGWTIPFLVDSGSEQCIVPFCPEIIAQTTEWLEDESRNDYLAVIETFIDAGAWKRTEPMADIIRFVEDTLDREADAAMMLLIEVELHARDLGIV